jgi:outer membrane immunogenic protein
MRRQILLASVGAIAIAGSAFAADLGPPPVYVPPPPIFTWSGLYIGGQIGYGWGKDSIDVTDTAFGVPGFFFSDNENNPDGVIGGAHVGYNLQFAQWVVGLEGSVDGSSQNGTVTDGVTGLMKETRLDVQGSIRARIGFAFDRVLIYATGGAAFSDVRNNYVDTSGIVTGTPGNSEQDSKTRAGWTVGGGIQYAVTNNWSIRAEYRYSDFGNNKDFAFTPTISAGSLFSPTGSVFFTHHVTENQVQAGLSYKFDLAPAPVVSKY